MFPSLGDAARGLQNTKLYLETAQQMLEHDPNNIAARFSVATAEYQVAYCLKESDPPAAIRFARDSIHTFDQMSATNKGDHHRANSGHVEGLLRLAEAQLKNGSPAEARASADSALVASRATATPSPEDRAVLMRVMIVSAKANAAIGDHQRAEELFKQALEQAKQIAHPEEVTSLIPLATAEEALGNFYAKQHNSQLARASYERLVKLWQDFPESNEYVDARRVSSQRLLSSLH